MIKKSLLGLAALGLMVAMYFGARNAVRWFQASPKSEAESSVRLSFHPDEVVALTWSVAGDEQKHMRNADLSWGKEIEASRMQYLLNELSLAHAERPAAPAKPLIKVTLDRGEKGVWVGVWAPGIFVWTEGFMKGMGKKLDPDADAFFYGGRHAFVEQNVRLCPLRIQAIEKLAQGKVISKISASDLSWSREPKGVAPPTADAMENWMSENCSFKAEQIFDRRLWQTQGSPDEAFRFKFVSGKTTTLERFDTIFVLNNDLTFRAKSLQMAIERLQF